MDLGPAGPSAPSPTAPASWRTVGGVTSFDAGPSVQYVLGRLRLVEDRVRHEIERLRDLAGGVGSDGSPGFYASHRHVDRLLAEGSGRAPVSTGQEATDFAAHLEDEADAALERGADVRLRSLASRMGLDEFDVEALLVAMAPAVDERFEALYAHLNDDRARRYATVGVIARLTGVEGALPQVRDRLGPDGPLVRGGLVAVRGGERPHTAAEVRVADRVVRHLLGSDVVDDLLAVVEVPALPVTTGTTDRLRAVLHAEATMAYVRDQEGVGGGSAAAAALAGLGLDCLMLDLDRLPAGSEVAALARLATCEAHLRGAGIVVGPVEVLVELGAHAVQAFADVDVPVVLVGRTPWDPVWSQRAPVTVRAELLGEAELHRLWAQALADTAVDPADAAAWTGSFRLTPQQVHRAAHSARRFAAAEGREPGKQDLQRGVRSQNATGLQRLARRIEPRVSWDDLVVPPRVESQLRELPIRWRHRDRVLEEWGMGRGVATGRGVSALFAGSSGTGKTLAAEVVAGDLGLDLYLVDLSTVVDKYIGETSKNLERIFDQADRVNGVLLFDEADALFGKRSAVSDAKDRHANVEVAFLLQRMETFDGVAILTTNLASNLDEAFMRRLDVIVDFPTPSEDQRRAIWKAKLGRGVPSAGDVDVDRLAELFTISGAEIANAIASAAYRAADRDAAVAMRDLVEAIIREHRKLGRHLTAGDLAEFAPLLEG